VGAGELLRRAREFPTVAEAVADCRLVVGTTAARRREIEQEICTLDHAAAPLRSALSQGGVAMLFGSEKHGLTRADLDHCHWLLRIPAEESQPSMNLGQAVAVCLWEIARGAAECEPARTTRAGAPEGGASAAPRVHTGRPAAAEELERLGRLWAEVLDAGGAARRRRASAPEAEVRRLLRRLNVSGEDARLLMGVARRLLWRLQGAPER
jgi:tRNA/rRNA methyltransferase